MKILGLLILLGGLLLMRRRVWMAWQSSGWPTTPGVVVAGARVYAGDSVEDGEPTYNARVEYTYVVAGRQYRGNLVEALPSVKSGEQAARVVEGYPPGLEVEVYFHPDDPRLSLLVPGLDGAMKVFLLVYVGCIVLLAASLFIDMPHDSGL